MRQQKVTFPVIDLKTNQVKMMTISKQLHDKIRCAAEDESQPASPGIVTLHVKKDRTDKTGYIVYRVNDNASWFEVLIEFLNKTIDKIAQNVRIHRR